MWAFHNPVSIHAGRGALARLPALLGARRAILIAFPEAAALGLIARVQALLGERLVAVEADVRPNPDVSWLAPMYERLWRDHADAECIIALGGGSSIDCAKAMLTAGVGGDFEALLVNLFKGADTNPALHGATHRRLIAIPTTSGTGSEVTPWATVWDQERACKHSLHLPWTWPEAAIIDAELMLTQPPSITLASGLDALSHALESLWNVHRNPLSAGFAVQAARAIIRDLPALLAAQADIALRESLALAALQAGLAFSNTRTALAHSLSYDITLAHGVPHGIACSFSLPHVMSMAFGRDAAVDAQLLAIFDTHDKTAAIDALSDFLERVGVSTDPAHYGIGPGQWAAAVDQALAGTRGRNFISQA
ncbi:iron-containing alcohol dehydrogenase PsrA [Uliginosibacterium sp. H3]|uniref:Iron-containing alcohol dehydrogenase PsrA n=1 Tax=Uliginosibacterium silvisoli TaxID=3114758 RepID=A0ABU6K249_9RHOO|nr:iron-containing alcohol dehydrogenase PsrA [Uliginosibacterium sp. H3]